MTARRWAWALAAVTAAGVTAQAVLLVLAGVPLLSAEAAGQTFPVVPLATLVGAMVGALIVGRWSDHRIGWLFCIGQAGAAVGLAAQALATAVLEHDIGLPAAIGRIALWVGDVLGATYALALLAALLLLAPDGRLPSRRWRPVFLLVAGSFGLTVAAMLMISPDRLDTRGIGTAEPLPLLVRAAGELGITAGLLGAAVAMTVRLRRARGEQRRQLRWIAVAALLLAAAVVVTVTVNLARGSEAAPLWYLTLILGLGYLTVPVATGFAVLRHRLYDIDVIIGSAVRPCGRRCSPTCSSRSPSSRCADASTSSPTGSCTAAARPPTTAWPTSPPGSAAGRPIRRCSRWSRGDARTWRARRMPWPR